MPKSLNAQKKEIADWNARIADMKNFSVNQWASEELEANKKSGKVYDRFIAEVKWSLVRGLSDAFDVEENRIYKYEVLPDSDWISDALNKTETAQSDFMEERSAESVDKFYEVALPMYRALKEDYQSRSIFQWIFNHAKYTAVRDSYKALEKTIKTVTGESQEQLNERYADFKSRIDDTLYDPEAAQREESELEGRRADYYAKLSGRRIEHAMDLIKAGRESVDEPEDEIDASVDLEVDRASEREPFSVNIDESKVDVSLPVSEEKIEAPSKQSTM